MALAALVAAGVLQDDMHVRQTIDRCTCDHEGRRSSRLRLAGFALSQVCQLEKSEARPLVEFEVTRRARESVKETRRR